MRMEMRVRTRNRIVIGVRITFVFGLIGLFGYKAYQVEPKSTMHAVIIGLIGFVGALIGRLLYVRTLERGLKQMRDQLGLKREDLSAVKEAPIPLVPTPLFPKNKMERVRAGFFIIMLVVLLILGWTGMLKKWFLE
jgi:hypothetical protein